MLTTRLVVSLAVVTLSTPALATNGMRMIGFGPVQNGMGGVSAAAPLDAAVVVTNPAGVDALAPRLDLAGTWFAPAVEFRATSPAPGMASGAARDSGRSPSLIPTFAAVYRKTDRLTLAVGALGTAGMGVEYPADLYGGRTYTSYMNVRVAPAASYRLTEELAVGISANLMYAMMEYDVAAGTGMVPREDGAALGAGATIGLTWRPAAYLTVGVAYESRSFFQDFEFDVPAHTLLTRDGPVDVPGGKETLAFDQPQVATVGAAVRPFPALLLAADVQWIDWSATNGPRLPALTSSAQLTGAMPWNLSWDDQVVLKLGAEYEAAKGLRLRAGYNYGKSPLDEARAFENVAFPAIAEHHVTVGAGYDVGLLAVNLAAMYSPEVTLRGANEAEQTISTYETRMSQLAFELGVGYRF